MDSTQLDSHITNSIITNIRINRSHFLVQSEPRLIPWSTKLWRPRVLRNMQATKSIKPH